MNTTLELLSEKGRRIAHVKGEFILDEIADESLW